MYVNYSEYKSFRNIENAKIEFCEGVNILYGGNAEGKTSAIEGIYLLSTGRSHRTAHESELIMYNCHFGMTGLSFDDGRRMRELEMYFLRGGKKSCLVGGIPVKKMSEFAGIFKAVLFCPEHLSIVKDGPSERRNFTDQAIARNDREYLSYLQNYNATLMQRNSILNDMMYGRYSLSDMLEPWSEKLCFFAEKISEKRENYINLLDKEVKTVFADMTKNGEVPSLTYQGGYTSDGLMAKLSQSREKEIKAGTTLFGIHKDDIEIRINGQLSRAYASQGQQRSLAVAMKLSEGEICLSQTGEYPVYLLDDILSELDDRRREYIVREFSPSGARKKQRQVIITCCDEATVEGAENAKKIKVVGGRYYY